MDTTTVEQWETMGYIAREHNGRVEVLAKIDNGGYSYEASLTEVCWVDEEWIQHSREWARPLALAKIPFNNLERKKTPIRFVHGHYTPTPLGGPHEKVD